MGFIYKITNSVTGKCYIGERIQQPNKRFLSHMKLIKGGRGCPALRDAVKKHGEEHFSFEILLECADEERFEKEKEYIRTYNSMVPNGYNILEGGQGCSGFKHSDETKARLSKVTKEKMKDPVRQEKLKEAHKKLWADPARRKENIEKISKGMIEFRKKQKESNPSKSVMSEERKEKIRKSVKEYYTNKETTKLSEETKQKIRDARSKSVIQYDIEGNLIRKFKSAKEATQVLNLPKGGISNVVRGKAKTCGGFVWKFDI
jgi:group I intron endonuclease